MDEVKERVSFPTFGGFKKFQNEVIKFNNACSVDTWIAILQAVDEMDAELLSNEEPSFHRLMQFTTCGKKMPENCSGC